MKHEQRYWRDLERRANISAYYREALTREFSKSNDAVKKLDEPVGAVTLLKEVTTHE